MEYGLQLYSVKDSASENFEATLAEVAKMGYTRVESAGFYGHTADEVKAMLERYGLTLCSTHTKFAEICEDIDAVIDFHKAVGCNDIVIPGAPQATRADVDFLIDTINRVQPKIAAAGMRLHFHNHSKEFLPNEDGQIVFEELLNRTDVNLQIDTFWVFNARRDPLEILEKYRNRIKCVHLKDGFPQDFSNPESCHVGKALGSGKAPVAAVRAKAIELGFGMVVECEGSELTGLEEARSSIEYLKTLEA